MDVLLPNMSTPLSGNEPIVILGANGSGKTKLAIELSKKTNADYIPALRNLSIPDQLHNWTLQTATTEFISRTNQRKDRYWELINEIDVLFAKLLSAHASQAMNVYDQVKKTGTPPPISDTVLDKTSDLWSIVFPGREISFKEYAPLVTSEYLGGSSYTAKHMSDGERTGLYLAARVLDSAQPIIVVDEPETHFHSRLAVRFWDALESKCADKRFIYITHDLTFALSRQDAQVVIVRAGQPPEALKSLSELPTDAINSILGAASFSVYARRIIFCEGEEGKSLDQELLRAWFHDKETALVPTGGCENVKRCTAAFTMNSVITGLKAIGIIDRDHWTDEILNNLGSDLHVLAVHEIESLYSIPEIYIAVAMHLGISENEAKNKYKNALSGFINNAKGSLTNKLIADRFKARVSALFERVFTEKPNYSDREKVLVSMTDDLANARPIMEAENLWNEEATLVDHALESGDPNQILRIFPGKPILPVLAQSLGISKERYCGLVKEGLNSKDSSMVNLSKGLETALIKYLPPRRYED